MPFLGVIVFLVLVSPLMLAQNLPTGFINAKVQTGYTTPAGVVFAPNTQQMFVWEKEGRVWVSNWNGTQYVRQPVPVLDISDEVGNWRDFGLQSMCLDPNFSQNGRIYLFYIVDRYHLLNAGKANYDSTQNAYFDATISRLTRYRLTTTNHGLMASPASRVVLLGESKSTGVPLTHESHAGGTVLFGDDGTLLLTTGDNASYNFADVGNGGGTYWQQAINDSIMRSNENVGAFRSQMLTSLCGKVLRLNPETGDGIASNPFYNAGSPRSARSRVWALGLRNPYRMAIQAGTGSTHPADANPGTLIVTDVGWNEWEEFTLIRRAGENAGWPLFEGLEPEPAYTRAAQTLANKDEPNPANTCSKPFLTFADLLKEARNETTGAATAHNPCGQQPLPGLQRRYFHSRPALDWKHAAGPARYPTFIGDSAVATSLGSASATVAGEPFGGNTAMAGAWYTGTRFPPEYRGAFFFADYGYNWIRAAILNANGVTEIKQFGPNHFGKGIVDLKYNQMDQSLYYVNINTGEIMRISYGGNQPPVAVITADRFTGNSPLTVAFRGSNSSDPDGDALTYAWDFGDGTTSTLTNPTHVFSATGQKGFLVRLTVADSSGLTAQEQVTISVGNVAPTVRITNPANGTLYPLNRPTQYTLKSAVSDDDPRGITYAWQVALRHNNHEHREPVLTQAQPIVTISPVGCDGETYYYMIWLTVTDQGGLTATDSVKIYPDCGSENLSVTNLTLDPKNQAVAVTWTNPAIAFDEVMVVAKQGSGFIHKPHGVSYTADANFAGQGSVLEGGKVVYKGTAATATVTGLVNGNKYFFRVYTRKDTVWTGGVEASATPIAPTNIADLSLALSVSHRAPQVGQPVTLTLTLTNGGPASAATATIQSRLPAGMTFVDASSSGVSAVSDVVGINAGTLMNGATASFVFRVKATQPGGFVTAAQVTASSVTDPDSQPNSGTGDGQDDMATVDLRTADESGPLTSSPNPNQTPLPGVQANQPPANPAKADLSLAMTTSALAPAVNAAVSLSLTVSNWGGSAATNVVVQTQLPAGWQLIDSNGLVVSGQSVTGTIASVPANGSATLTLPVRVSGAGTLNAQITSARPADSDSEPGNGFQNGEDDEATLMVRIRP